MGMMVHTYNPSIREAEAGRSQVGVQPALHSDTLSQKKKKERKNKQEKLTNGREVEL
jgi:hypothetical protein